MLDSQELTTLLQLLNVSPLRSKTSGYAICGTVLVTARYLYARSMAFHVSPGATLLRRETDRPIGPLKAIHVVERVR